MPLEAERSSDLFSKSNFFSHHQSFFPLSLDTKSTTRLSIKVQKNYECNIFFHNLKKKKILRQMTQALLYIRRLIHGATLTPVCHIAGCSHPTVQHVSQSGSK